jgi:hypothetical protein
MGRCGDCIERGETEEPGEEKATPPVTSLETSPETAGAQAPASVPPQQAEKAPMRPRLTDRRKVELMKQLGTDIAKLKQALNLPANATDKALVDAVKAKQKQLWIALKAGFDDEERFKKKHPKFASAEKFEDGIWGQATRDALKAVAHSAYVDEKWKNMYAALGGGDKDKQDVAAASPKAAPGEIAKQPLSLSTISSMVYPEDTVPTPESISLAADVRHIHKNDAIVIQGTGQVAVVLNIAAVNNELKEKPPLTLLVQTLDGKQLPIYAAGDADDLSEEVRVATPEEKDKFVKDRHARALAEYHEKAARDRQVINEAISKASPDAFKNQEQYAKLKPGKIKIVFIGKESGVKVEGEAQGDSPVAVLNRTSDSERVLVITQTGRTGWIKTNNLFQDSLTKKGAGESLNIVLARVESLANGNKVAAAAPPAPRPKPSASAQVVDKEQPPA